ncbi:MAG: zincin-like metallopeptidase domain-containing protein [Leptolyngbyaceae cyanobacterium]
MPKNTRKACDKFQLIANKLLHLMESGTLPWRKPWHCIPSGNAITGHEYSGMNPLLAQIDVMASNYSTTLFAGISQAKERNWQVKKGSKATWLRHGCTICKEEEDTLTGAISKQVFPSVRWLQVFNLDCFDDSEAETKVADVIAKFQGPENTDPRIDQAEAFIASQNATIQHGGNRACYNAETDRIQLPAFKDFSSAELYYSTALHELAHWTGHSSRLDRKLQNRFGSRAYAFEELVAELGAAFVCNELALTPALEHHASYLEGWMSIIKRDHKAFFKAISLAQKAATLLLEKAEVVIDAPNTDVSDDEDAEDALSNEQLEAVMTQRRAVITDKQEHRRERYEELATKHQRQSSDHFQTASRMGSVIPFGQPILVGHHSERSDRAYRGRIGRHMDKGVEHSRTADYYRGKLTAMDHNQAISSDDPDALAKLRDKLASMEANQHFMKEANKLVRKVLKMTDLDLSQQVEKLVELAEAKDLEMTAQVAEGLLTPDFAKRTGFPAYELQNNNGNMRRVRERIAELERQYERIAEQGEGASTTYPDLGLEVVHNNVLNRIQLIFDSKPSEEIRAIVKTHGFRWARSERAWQRQLNPTGIAAAEIVVKQLQPIQLPSGDQSAGR